MQCNLQSPSTAFKSCWNLLHGLDNKCMKMSLTVLTTVGPLAAGVKTCEPATRMVVVPGVKVTGAFIRGVAVTETQQQDLAKRDYTPFSIDVFFLFSTLIQLKQKQISWKKASHFPPKSQHCTKLGKTMQLGKPKAHNPR